jgi:retron-type reverse transcriptase
MAKSYRHLFERIYDFENLYRAYLKARRGKRRSDEVLRFENDLEGNLIGLQNELIWGQYKTGAYRYFTVYEPKERQVAALPFRDRVLQHAVVAVIEPIWEARFIADSYACRVGKGTHAGADRAEQMMRQVKREHGEVWALKADVSRYFQSIDHGRLKGLLRRYIRCPRTLRLLNEIIDSAGDGVGLPIGNLTSQLFANVYLHALDEFVKYDLRERYYVRYMDDFVILSNDKAQLQSLRIEIEAMLWRRLCLVTNSKTHIFRVGGLRGRALDFLGYRIYPTHRLIRKASARRADRALRRLRSAYKKGVISLDRVRQTVASWVAHASHASSEKIRKAVLEKFAFVRRD